jgi:hypothetical protein
MGWASSRGSKRSGTSCSKLRKSSSSSWRCWNVNRASWLGLLSTLGRRASLELMSAQGRIWIRACFSRSCRRLRSRSQVEERIHHTRIINLQNLEFSATLTIWNNIQVKFKRPWNATSAKRLPKTRRLWNRLTKELRMADSQAQLRTGTW